jgi:hypothetical protein
MSSWAQNALYKLSGLKDLVRQEVARKAMVGGVQAHWGGDDGLVGDIALIEETLSQFNVITKMHRDRKIRYRDYEAMDNYGDVSVALDMYAEEATPPDLVRDTNLWFTSDDSATVQMLEDTTRRLRFRTLLHGFARQLAKYGDLFISPRYSHRGIERIYYLPPHFVTRIGPGIDAIKHFQLESQLAQLSPRKDGTLLPWECVHFRLLAFGFSTVYGRSMLEPSRKRWLHLKLIEDAVAIYRLNRAVERLIYYIDVGQASPMEALSIVNQFKRKFGNKRSYLDPSQPQFEQQYDPTNMMENIFWPVNSANERSRIEKLNPPPDQNQLQDLDHFNQKLYVALGIPKDYLTGDVSGTWNSRESLSLQDVRFSRKIHRLQVALVEGMETMLRYHIAVVTGDADKAANAEFKVHLADVSQVARQQYDQILLNRVQLLSSLNSLGAEMQFNREVWVKYIMNVFFPDVPKNVVNTLVIPDRVLAAAQGGPPQPGQATRESLQEMVGGNLNRRVVEEEIAKIQDFLENWEPDPETVRRVQEEYLSPKIPKKWLEEAAGINKKSRKTIVSSKLNS